MTNHGNCILTSSLADKWGDKRCTSELNYRRGECLCVNQSDARPISYSAAMPLMTPLALNMFLGITKRKWSNTHQVVSCLGWLTQRRSGLKCRYERSYGQATSSMVNPLLSFKLLSWTCCWGRENKQFEVQYIVCTEEPDKVTCAQPIEKQTRETVINFWLFSPNESWP